MKGEGFKVRLRDRRGYVSEAGGYAAWSEYQVVAGRKIVARLETFAQVQKEYPRAVLDVSVTHAQAIAAKQRSKR
jgi:hypothetical protein